MTLLLVGVALFSMADPGRLAWLAVRTVLFLALAPMVWKRQQDVLPGLAAGLAAIALGGLGAIDFALVALLAPVFRVSLRSIGVICAMAAVAGAIGLVFADQTFPLRNRNHFAVLTELSLPILVYCWRRDRRPLWLGMAALLVVTALAAGSRVGAVLILLEVLALWTMTGGLAQLRFAVPTVAIAATFFVLLSTESRLLNPFQGDHRLEIWQSTIDMIAERPWLGWGAGQFSRIYPQFARFDNGQFVNAAHSDWLEWMVEYGLAGAVALGIVGLQWMRKCLHFTPSWGILVGALHAAVDFPFHVPGLFLLTVIAAVSIYRHAQNPETQSTDRQGRDPSVPEEGRLVRIPRGAGHVAREPVGMVGHRT